MLWLCLDLPRLALEVFARGRDMPEALAVTEGEGRAQRVHIANAAARRRGIRAGMTLASAYALAADLRARARDEAAECAALERLAAWALQFTSHVSLESAQALLLEIEGSLKIFGGLALLRQRLRAELTGLGYRARLSVAPTPLAAAWFARTGDDSPVTDLRALAARLFALPIDCLDLSEAQRALLHGLGVRQLGECLRLPRDGLARRLGAQFVSDIDRAFGRLPDPRKPFVAPPAYDGRLSLPTAVDDVDGLLFSLNRLLLELSGFLAARHAGVQELVLVLHYPKLPPTKILLRLARSTRDARRLAELFRERLARVALAEPVEEIALSASQPLPLAATNGDFFAPSRAPADLGTDLIERLRARLGQEAVQGLVALAEHRPERAWRYVEPGASASLAQYRDRPLWLLPKALPLAVRDGRPYLDGALELEVDRERIESGWWDGSDIRRDYFIARDRAGVFLWVYRELSGEQGWWLQGIFG